MAGLVPAIHVLFQLLREASKGDKRKHVDDRDKPGHDELKWKGHYP